MQQRQQQNDQLQMKDAFNLFYLLANSHATTCTVFLRTDFGRDGIGVHGMFGFFMILLWGGTTTSHAMYVFLCAYLLAVLSQRMKTYANSRKGIIPHSRYNGFPVVSKRLFPRMSERNAIGMDAFLCLAIGGFLLNFVDQALGYFVMAGFLSILLSEGTNNELQRKRLQAMRDAEIEQRYLAETYKSGRF